MLLKGIALISALLALALYAFCGFTLWQALLSFLGSALALALLSFGGLLLLLSRVDLSRPQEHDDPLYRKVMYVFVEALIMLLGVRIHPKGLEKTPAEGRFLLVCNHLGDPDPGILLHCFRKSQLAFVTKWENMRMFAVGKFMHKTMCQPIKRENDREALKTILNCIRLLKEDEVSIVIFPEGYTSGDGRLHHFRAGAFKIAQKANVPIVVCTLQNTDTSRLFHNAKRLKKTDVELHLLDVIPAEELKGQTTVQISNRVYEMMIADLGEGFRVPPEEEITH